MLLLSDLKPGHLAKISAISDDLLGSKLMDLGCFVGQNIELTNIAPFGCPIAFKVLDSVVSIRLKDAKKIQVEHIA
ncbi:MAG: ferrous iron transport protein A [Bacteroidota bacterium]|nr:ferrous iron transport protein A [Bacteroidota bacterium]MCA6442247.1 ferrous iron transport protein A [Bacteroidota bacterium]